MPGKAKNHSSKKAHAAKSRKKRVSPTKKHAATKAAAKHAAAKYPAQKSVAGPIEHVVVLMMENRSFDHIFGYRRFRDR